MIRGGAKRVDASWNLGPLVAYPVLIMGLAMVFVTASDSILGHAAALLAGALSPLALMYGLRRYRPSARLTWLLLLAGQVLWVVVSALNSYHTLTGRELTIPVGDGSLTYALLFVLAGYAFFVAAIQALQVDVPPRYRRAAVLDAGLIIVGMGLASFLAVVLPALQRDLTTGERVSAIAHPLADILIVAFLCRSFTTPGRRSVTLRLMLYGASLLVASHTLEQAIKVHQMESQVLQLVTVGTWYIALIMISLAPLHPSMVNMAPAPTTRYRVGLRRLALMTVALLGPWAVVIGSARAGLSVPLAPVMVAALVQVALTLQRVRDLLEDLESQSQRLDQASRTDHLTGLPNRRDADATMSAAMAQPGPVALALVDLDHFKRVNDTLGHQAGDSLLREAALAWGDALGERGYLARFGGEEFLLVLRGPHAEQGETILQDLRAVTPRGQSFSAGLARRVLRENGDQVLRRADDLLYSAKAAGRARTHSDAAGMPREMVA